MTKQEFLTILQTRFETENPLHGHDLTADYEHAVAVLSRLDDEWFHQSRRILKTIAKKYPETFWNEIHFIDGII